MSSLEPDVDRLRRNLKEAREWAARKPREGTIRALIGLQQFLDRVGLPPEDQEVLFELVEALSEADRGVTHPLLKVERARGAPPKRGSRARLEAHAAVAVSLLKEAGCTIDAAAHKVAEAVGPELTPDQIKTARKNIMGRRAPDYIVDDFYESTLSFLSAPRADGSISTKEQRANRALRAVRKIARRKV